MAGINAALLETTPKWLGLTLGSSACALVAVGVGVLTSQIVDYTITPYTLFLHLVLSITFSSWILNLRIKMSPEKRPLLAIAIVVAVGVLWSSLQQWLGYVATGTASDITLVVGALVMDAVGGGLVYFLFRLNMLGKKF